MGDKRLAITFAESAIQDLLEIKEYYREQQVPEIGERYVREIFILVEGLRTHPDRGRVVPEFDHANLKELIHPPFRIVYRHENKKIQIVRVWRSERLMHLP